jgi:hypothetical protein
VTLLRTLLPQAEFSLTSLTSGAPYGTTRVYARQFPGSATSSVPSVNAWDSGLQCWLHRSEPIADVHWSKGEGSLHIVRGARKWTWDATDTVVADLPSGWYLLRTLGTGEPRSRQMLTGGSSTSHDFPVGDLPPPIDVAVRLAPEPAYLLLHHEGGPLGINLFAAEPGARRGAVETFRVFGLDDYRPQRERGQEQPLPNLSTWAPDTAGVSPHRARTTP